jgi:hypothetical protein
MDNFSLNYDNIGHAKVNEFQKNRSAIGGIGEQHLNVSQSDHMKGIKI